ncbi:MAG: OsmC family protein [Anaerolineae bacterium]|jgi:uncharacterized OsmC-like protein
MELTVEHVDNLRFRVSAGRNATTVDAAPEDGGGGTALSAPSLFVAAIGACMLEFVVNSCRLRGVPVDQLSLTMTYEEVSRPRRIARLGTTLRLEPEPSRRVQRRLIGVARHATLVNTLARPMDLDIRFEGT